MTSIIAPGSPEWAATISPSKAAAILGVSRWESPYRLWHRMKANLDPGWHEAHDLARPEPEPHKDIFDTGHAMELALAYLWKLENPGWQLSPGEVQVSTDQFGFPAVATVDRRARRGSGYRRIVEFKTARSLEEWGDDFTDNAPDDYLIQVTIQMLLTGWNKEPAHLVVLGPYLRHHTYVIPYDNELGAQILDACARWWKSLQADEPPELDDTVATYECVRELHPQIDGTTVELDPMLAKQWLFANADRKQAEVDERELKTRVADLMGNAQHAEIARGNERIKVASRRSIRGGTPSIYAAAKALEKIGETA